MSKRAERRHHKFRMRRQAMRFCQRVRQKEAEPDDWFSKHIRDPFTRKVLRKAFPPEDVIPDGPMHTGYDVTVIWTGTTDANW